MLFRSRYKKSFNKAIPYSSQKWILINVWSANRTNINAEKVEENQRFVKLIFPVKKNRIWNGNAANSLDERIYEYIDIDISRTLSSFNFDSTCFIKQIDNETLIDKKYYVEIYAKNIGMIYTQVIDVKSSAIIPKIPVMGRISSGLEYKMTVNAYGVN